MKKGQQARLALSGSAAGFLNGLLGAGGGMVLLPALMWFCGLEGRRACATSVAVIAPLCGISAALWLGKGGTPPPVTLWYCIGGLAGGLLGGRLLGRLPVKWLLRLFGGLMLVSGLRLLIG